MSDLDASLQRLRDELTAAIPLPDVEHVTGRARTRRRLQLGAIAAVIAVALAVPVLRALPSGSPAGTPPSPPKTTYAVDFADPDHGYALSRRCDQIAEGCSFDFYRTVDGGRDWQKMSLPEPSNAKTGYFNADLYALGPDEAAIDVDTSKGMVGRIHTVNGGRTWQAVEHPWTSNTTTRLGPRSMLGGTCGTYVMATGTYLLPDGLCSGLSTVRPDSGKAVGIPTLVPRQGFVQQSGWFATEDGKWWVCVLDDATDQWTISVSADGAGTWSTSDLGVDNSPRVDGWAVVERNGVMYATASTYNGLLGVWRSIDDGHSWTRTWRRGGDQWLPGLIGTPIAAGDGSLALSDGLTTFVSTDQGRTFKRTGDKVAGTVRWTRAGYLRSDGMLYSTSSSGTRFALSTDGLHWREFTVH